MPNPHANGHREAVGSMHIPAQGADSYVLKALGIELEPVKHSNLIDATFPAGWLRKCGANGEWLFPTELVGPDGTELIIEYEENNTVIVSPRISETEKAAS